MFLSKEEGLSFQGHDPWLPCENDAEDAAIGNLVSYGPR